MEPIEFAKPKLKLNTLKLLIFLHIQKPSIHFLPFNTQLIDYQYLIYSVVEMVVFLLICIGCFFLYYRWNTVPNKEFEIQIEDLSNGVVYDSTRVQVDSVRRVFACNINYNIPMTNHDEFVEGLKSCTVDLSPLYSDDKHSDFLDYTFLNDSIRNGLIRNDPCTYPLLNKYNLSKLFEYKFRFDSASTIVIKHD